MAVAKALVRYTVIAGLVGGTAALIAGPERLGALVTQTRQSIHGQIDKHIQDPIALRAQLKSLEGQYPERIAEVRGDLADLKAQVAQLNRELEVSERVVELSRHDADQIHALISRAESAQTTLASTGANQIVRVSFDNQSMDLPDAYAKANKIRQVHNAYVARAEDIQRDLGYLAQQEERLAKLNDQLQTEHAEFQTQMWQLDRQVDTIARNDRMIDMMQKRQRTLEDNSRYSAHSLDQITARFADIRARQEAKLETLGTASATTNYEDRAKFDLDAKKAWSAPDATQTGYKKLAPRPTVIEIAPGDLAPLQIVPESPAEPKCPTTGKPIASRGH